VVGETQLVVTRPPPPRQDRQRQNLDDLLDDGVVRVRGGGDHIVQRPAGHSCDDARARDLEQHGHGAARVEADPQRLQERRDPQRAAPRAERRQLQHADDGGDRHQQDHRAMSFPAAARFDRAGAGRRIGYVSAMTILEAADGDRRS
jgi:hypothetical protein